MDDDERRFALAAAVRAEMEERGITQAELGAELANVLGRAEPYTQSYISDLTKGRRPMQPSMVFAVERALKVKPGTFSRVVGFLPLEHEAVLSVSQAVERARELDPAQREDLIAIYDGMVERTQARRETRRSRAGQ